MDPQPENALIRIALVEDDVSFQNAVAAAIQDAADMELVGTYSTRSDGLAALGGPPVDVLLLDLGLPDGSGIDVIHAAQAHWPKCSVMVCTAFGDEAHVLQSIEAGASGYLLKDSTPALMVGEIRALHGGGSPISPLIARQVLMRFRQSGKPRASDASPGNVRAALSAREREVLELITKGFTYDEIAGLMRVSRHTVLTFVRRIYAKLEVGSKAEAIYEARNQGLLAD